MRTGREPAAGKNWRFKMAAEEGDTREPVTKEVRLLVPIEKNQAEPKRIGYGVVLEPDTEDLQGDVMSSEDIEQAAYDWMERSQAGGHMHSQLVEGAKVVERTSPLRHPRRDGGGSRHHPQGLLGASHALARGDLGQHHQGSADRVFSGRDRRARNARRRGKAR